MTARWAKLDSMRWKRDVQGGRGCRYCLNSGQGDVDCKPATCQACGSVQCLHAGSGGRCGVCLVGIVEGWSGWNRPCGYRGCSERAVAEAPRVRNVCAEHALKARTTFGAKVTLAEYIRVRLEERAKNWTLIDLGERSKNPTSI